jgi:hypothetical protein
MKYVVYLFSAIGFVSTIAILGLVIAMNMPWSNEEGEAFANRCLEDGGVVRLDSYFDEDEESMYELIAYTTGFSDKVTYITLVKGKYFASSSNCIEQEKIVFSDSIYYGEENGPEVQWPKAIQVFGDAVKIEYTKDRTERSRLANVPVSWN